MSHYTFTEKDIQRFWAKVDKSGGEDACWEWQGAKTKGGYGNVGIRRLNFYSHRLAYIFTYGENPSDLLVCHHCDNRKCCNPKHLFLGTHRDNLADMRQKLRHPYGEKSATAKLTSNQVMEIRSRWNQGDIQQKELAKQYGVSRSQISRIVLGQRWRQN